jgi:hypothetical protein
MKSFVTRTDRQYNDTIQVKDDSMFYYLPKQQITEECRLLGCYSVWLVVLTRAARRNITEDGILHSHRREKLTFYTANY